MASQDKGQKGPNESEEPVIRNKRKIDPETGQARTGDAANADGLIQAEGPDAELSEEDTALLAEAERDLVAEYRERAARAEAELKNFRTRVERDRGANREAVIAEVIRTLLPAIDDLDRAEAHGDLTEGSPLAIVAQKLRAGFERYGLRRVGEVGEPFDPQVHEAIVQVPTAGVTVNTVADVIEPGYGLGERLIRAAKVAVSVPE
ncbi:MAG: nucleotide exchange factor GrpE [Acidobacteria bacterium]|nr:nucleotide exchange factor GrpE [Acidobacteriota bacterium]